MIFCKNGVRIFAEIFRNYANAKVYNDICLFELFLNEYYEMYLYFQWSKYWIHCLEMCHMYLAEQSEVLCKIRIFSFKNWTSHHFSNASFVCFFFLQILRQNIYKLTCFVHHGIITSSLFNLRKYHISQFSNDDSAR